MKIDWIESKSTKFIELNYDFTKSEKIRIPLNLKGKIIKLNFKLIQNKNHRALVDKVFLLVQKQKPLRVFQGKMNVAIVIDERKKEEKILQENLSREELVQEYIKHFCPEEMKKEVKKASRKILGRLE